MLKKLTEAQVAQYRQQGFIFPVHAFSPEQAARYRRCLEAFESSAGRQLGKGFNFKPHLLFTWVDEIVRHPAILDAVEDLIGPDIRLFHLTVWPKNPQDPAFVGWHQDGTYFGLEPAAQVTAWVALTDAPIEAGCMEVVAGSHLQGQRHHHETPSPHNLLSRGQTLTEGVDRHGTMFMPVKAGEFSLHHTHLVHCSGPNRANDRRIGFGLSYIPTHVRCTSATRLTAMLVRGVDRYGHFDDERRPQIDYGDAERAFHAQAVARFRQSNAEQTRRYAAAPVAS